MPKQKTISRVPLFRVFKREFLAYFRLPLAYVFLSVFLAGWMGITWFVDRFFEADEASLEIFFKWLPWMYIFLIPAIGMRLWAEDRKSGAWELLASAPLSPISLVLGKFLAGWMVISIGLLLSFSMVATIDYLGTPDWGPVISSYLGAWLMGGAYLGVCLLAGSHTRHQLTAFVCGASACLLLILLGFNPFSELLLSLGLPVILVDLFANFSFTAHFSPFIRGMIALQDVGFFLTLIVLALGLSVSEVTIGMTYLRLKQIGFALLLLGAWALLPHFQWRYDTTESQVYTLSSDTQNVLDKLTEPVEISLYFSESLEGLPIGLKNYVGRLRYFLERYAEASKGKVYIRYVDTAESIALEQEAELRGIQGRVLPSSDWWCLGLSIKQVDRYVPIPALSPVREHLLELEITKALVHVIGSERVRLGILSRLNVLGGEKEKPWHIINLLNERYDCEKITLSDLEKPADIINHYDMLLILHPPTLESSHQKSLQTFLQAGKSAVILLDPLCFKEQSSGKVQGIVQGYGSSLSGLLDQWGIRYASDQVAADFRTALTIPTKEGGVLYPIAMDVKRFNEKELSVASLRSVRLIAPGFFELKREMPHGLQASYLLRTSNRSGSIYASTVSVLEDAKVIERVEKIYGFKDLGLLLTGDFSKGNPLSQAGAVALIADVDFIADAIVAGNPDQGKQQPAFADNVHLFINLIDNLSGQGGLFALRGKGRTSRPLERAHRLFVKVRDHYGEDFTSIALRRQQIKNDQQALIKEVQAFGKKHPASMGVPEHFSERFRALHQEDQALEEKSREIQRALRMHIRRLKLTLGMLNVLAPSATLSLLGLFVLGYRGFRATRRHQSP